MDAAFFYIGAIAVVFGAGGVAFTLYRAVAGAIFPSKAGVDLSFALGTVSIGVYLISDSKLLLLSGVVLTIAAGFFEARRRHVPEGG